MNGDILVLNVDEEQTYKGFHILNTHVGMLITNNAIANYGQRMVLSSTAPLHEMHLPQNDQGHTVESRITRGFTINSKRLCHSRIPGMWRFIYCLIHL